MDPPSFRLVDDPLYLLSYSHLIKICKMSSLSTMRCQSVLWLEYISIAVLFNASSSLNLKHSHSSKYMHKLVFPTHALIPSDISPLIENETGHIKGCKSQVCQPQFMPCVGGFSHLFIFTLFLHFCLLASFSKQNISHHNILKSEKTRYLNVMCFQTNNHM